MKQLKYLLSIIILTTVIVRVDAQFNSFDNLHKLKSIQSKENPGRAYLVLYKSDEIIDTIFSTYYSFERKWKGFESFFIESEKEIAFINQGMYRLMRRQDNGKWKTIDFFQLMYCNWIDGVVTIKTNYCCTRWKLGGLRNLYRSDMKDCEQKPIWSRVNFNEVRNKVQHLKGGTPENKAWINRIRKELKQDSTIQKNTNNEK